LVYVCCRFSSGEGEARKPAALFSVSARAKPGSRQHCSACRRGRSPEAGVSATLPLGIGNPAPWRSGNSPLVSARCQPLLGEVSTFCIEVSTFPGGVASSRLFRRILRFPVVTETAHGNGANFKLRVQSGVLIHSGGRKWLKNDLWRFPHPGSGVIPGYSGSG